MEKLWNWTKDISRNPWRELPKIARICSCKPLQISTLGNSLHCLKGHTRAVYIRYTSSLVTLPHLRQQSQPTWIISFSMLDVVPICSHIQKKLIILALIIQIFSNNDFLSTIIPFYCKIVQIWNNSFSMLFDSSPARFSIVRLVLFSGISVIRH